jgi:hypothetical protein
VHLRPPVCRETEVCSGPELLAVLPTAKEQVSCANESCAYAARRTRYKVTGCEIPLNSR